jgi:hypothetical protein
MLRTKNQVLNLLQEIHETEEQIAKICFMHDRVEIVNQLNSIGLDIIDDANPEEITMKGNFDPKRISFTIGEDPFTISKTIVLALSGIHSIPIYLTLNSKIRQQHIVRNRVTSIC